MRAAISTKLRLRNTDGRFASGTSTPARAVSLTAVAVALVVTASGAPAQAITAPPIRLSDTNQVPACVTPERLMAFLATRNKRLIPRFRTIAKWYKQHGETWRVRWDYAFFQMAIETNFLTYRRPNGKWGDVNPKQNNFAGLGTTGGGVHGDSYPDVSTGVLAQIQHLVAYSGERMKNPVGPRTRLKQDVIVRLSAPIAARRPVTFQDLSGRWAVDKRYGRSINYVASLFAKRYCNGSLEAARVAPRETRRTAVTATAQPTGRPTAPAKRCTVGIASFGGSRTVLIAARQNDTLALTALDVEPAKADAMTRSFIEQYATDGRTIGIYDNRRAALSEAYKRCPSAAAPLDQKR